jgi:hypothetical protein
MAGNKTSSQKTSIYAVLTVVVVFFGLLIWAKLKLLEEVPRNAIAKPTQSKQSQPQD